MEDLSTLLDTMHLVFRKFVKPCFHPNEQANLRIGIAKQLTVVN